MRRTASTLTANLFANSLPMPPRAGEYKTLYIDSPWPESGGGKIKRGADRHYPLMKVQAIVELFRSFGAWAAPDAHLYSWTTNNYLPAGFQCISAASFRYVTKTTWVKDKMGIGQYYRGLSEDCLFAVRGGCGYRIAPDGKRAQGVTAFYEPEDTYDCIEPPCLLPEAFEAPRTRHSKKPQKMREFIELVSPGPYLEIFAIGDLPPGWDGWGNGVFQ